MTTSTTTEILVFKTNIRFKKDLQLVASSMDGNERILEWNVDREDIDHVLRVASNEIAPEEVIQLIEEAGFLCQELSD